MKLDVNFRELVFYIFYLNSIHKVFLPTYAQIALGIYIPLTLPLKERIRGRTKLSEGQLFTFRDRQDSCLPSAARLDSPGDQGKGKVGPKKVLFFQEYDFFQG